MRLDIYVNYRGTCEQAFRFYEHYATGAARPGCSCIKPKPLTGVRTACDAER